MWPATTSDLATALQCLNLVKELMLLHSRMANMLRNTIIVRLTDALPLFQTLALLCSAPSWWRSLGCCT